MTRPSASVLAPLLLAIWLLPCSGCDRSPKLAPGVDAFEALAEGAFLLRDPWLDVVGLYRDQRATGQNGEAWRVPHQRWIRVEDEGWGGAEEWGAWGLGERTRIRFFLRSPEPYDFFIAAMAPPDPDQRPQTVAVRINDRKLNELTIGPEWEEHRFEVPPEVLRPGWNDLELAYAYHLDGSLENDDRHLALAFERLGLVPRAKKPRASGAGPGFRVFREQEILVLEASGTYVTPLDIPLDADRLDLDLLASGQMAEMSLEAGLLTLDGREEPLGRFSADGPAPRLPLSAHRGSQVLLVLDADLPTGEHFTIRRVAVIGGKASSGGKAPPTASKAAALTQRPPIVLIVLDAARADHFGVYGYERDTTPHIDALASESLVFRNVVAECSYTLCSMPSLLTGLSFVQHGMVTKQLVLKDEVETLAEVLSGQGYLTLGYTGNPNNSRVTGTHQGFDEFSEIWKTHPDHITARVEKRLGRADVADRPFFLMLHYVPPHEPYDPDPEFDIFGDPAYDGPVTSDRDFTRDVYSQKITLNDADLAEMVALYDGNLRMGDATVGRILGFLKDSGLYDDALVIVTSDHGEAFLEHGRVGHNTTLYEEMLRVPLIVKPPKSWATPEHVDLERLATLPDVPATLLSLLGLEASPQALGRNLLASAAESTAEGLVYLRSAHASRPILGVRTGRFKVLTRVDSPPEFYDLRQDPDEEVNVLAENPVLHTGLSLMLARAIRQSGPLRAGVRKGKISEKDRAMLRALGYL